MSAWRAVVGVALASAAVASALPARAEPRLSPRASSLGGARRVGCAVSIDAGAAMSGAGESGALASIRADLAARGFARLPPGALRTALEESLPPDEGDAARARAGRRLDAAREAYAGFEYDRARTALEEIDRLLVDRPPSPAVVDLLIERHLLAGLVDEGRGRPADARRAFRLVHHLDPDRRGLDPGAYRPHVVALFAQVVRAADRPGPLRVETEPAGARIWVDGHFAGESPVALGAVAAGGHWVVAAAPGRRSIGVIVETDPDRRETGRLSLALAPSAPAERAAELRRALAAAGDRERRGAAAELARTAGVDLLVLVRTGEGGAEAAVFDAASGALSPWSPVRRERRPLDRAPVASAPGRTDLTAAPAPVAAGDSPSWYGTWWGRTLLVAGGLAVGGAVVYALGAGDGDSYSVGGFCFAGEDC